MNIDYRITKDSNNILNIITVVIENQSGIRPTNSNRLSFMKDIISENKVSDIILFPAGYFELGKQSKSKIIELCEKISLCLKEAESSSVICAGIDCDDGRDQLAVAVNKAEILAIGRKFYPTSAEKEFVRKAPSFNCPEMGYPRIFNLKSKKIYLAVCYDVFGIRHCTSPDSDIDATLVLAHQFRKRGEGSSGDVDFARKGFAGASQHWMCPVFGTAVFFCRSIPENWPTGVLWTDKNSDVRHFKYSKNELLWNDCFRINGKKENALIYKYTSE